LLNFFIKYNKILTANDKKIITKIIFNYDNPKFLPLILLFLVFLFPELDPAVFQRILIAKNTAQVSKSFIVAGVIRHW